jgi:hypothetical protein
MRLLACFLVFASWGHAALCKVTVTGDKDTVGIWDCGHVPSTGDTVNVPNTFALAVSTNWTFDTVAVGTRVSLSVGTSPGNNSNNIFNTAQITFSPGVSIAMGGAFTVINQNSNSFPNPTFHPVVLGAGSTVAWQYYFGADTNSAGGGAFNCVNCTIQANGTVGSHVTLTTTAGTTAASFSQNGGLYNGFGMDLHYTDIQNFGDSTHDNILQGSGGTQGAALTLDHVVMTGGGTWSWQRFGANDGWSITHSGCSTVAASVDACWLPFFALANSTATRTFDSNWTGANIPAFPISGSRIPIKLAITNSIIVGNPAGNIVLDGSTQTAAAALGDSLWLHEQNQPDGTTFATYARNIFVIYGDVFNSHTLNPTGTATFSKSMWDNSSNCDGSAGCLFSDTGENTLAASGTLTFTGNISGCGATLSPGFIVPYLGTNTGLNFPSVANNTTCSAGAPNSGQDVTITDTEENTTLPAGTWVSVINNLQYGLTNPAGNVHRDQSASLGFACNSNAVTTLDYNLYWNNLTTETSVCGATYANGVFGKFTATPNTHGLNVNPQMVDDSRSILSASPSMAALGDATCTAWVVSHVYNAGDCASVSLAGYFKGNAINYTVVAAHTSSAANKPQSVQSAQGLNWRLQWEPKSFTDIRTALQGVATSPIPAIMGWIRQGYAPKNSVTWNAGSNRTTPGACQPTMFPMPGNMRACQ